MSTVDLETIDYLEALEKRLTGMLHLTNGTPARPVLLEILTQDLRPTIEQCHWALDEMATDLCADEEVCPLAEC